MEKVRRERLSCCESRDARHRFSSPARLRWKWEKVGESKNWFVIKFVRMSTTITARGWSAGRRSEKQLTWILLFVLTVSRRLKSWKKHNNYARVSSRLYELFKSRASCLSSEASSMASSPAHTCFNRNIHARRSWELSPRPSSIELR